MAFNLQWAQGAANSARGWTRALGGEASPEFGFCFREALNGARTAVREGEMVERTLHSKGKANS